MRNPAVILSTHNIGLGLIRTLGRCGVPIIAVYYQKQDMGYLSRYVQERVPAPHPEHSEEDFIRLLVDLAARHGRCVLFPADDATLVAVSKNRSRLAEHHIVACAEWTTVRQLIDKKHTYRLAESIGIPAPRTITPRDIDDAEEYAASARYPCLVKPCESHRYFEIFRRKLVKVANANELLAAYRQASDAGMEVMLQEYIPGTDADGVNYNSYCCDGTTVAEFTARKVRMSPPEFGVPAVVVSRHIPEVQDLGRRLLQSLGYTGYSCTEFRRDPRDGIYKLMEINPRHNRSLMLAVTCSVNFPLMEYTHLVDGRVPSPAEYRDGIYWIDAAKDLAAGRQYRARDEFSWVEYVRPYLKPHVFATFDVRDPVPFLKRSTDILRMACRAAVRSARPRSTHEQVLPGANT
ncbi:MAG: hypothetical protein A2Y76_01305 [Planctomycetes bacterium RBG_13_60_9]|nr:MAG: hypothetical protein A2Y76_01305 [Planctomycetes bacterium RBG_13_60_9]